MKIRTIVFAAIGVVVLIVAGLAVFLLTLDVNQYKGRIAEAVKDATGRELTIKGDIKLSLGLTPSLVVNDVSFQNAPWGTRPQMATIKHFEAEVALIPLLSGNAEVKKLILDGADILVETDARGRSNLEFAETAADKPKAPPPAQQGAAKQATIPTVNLVQIQDALLTYNDGKTKQRTTVKVEKLGLGADTASSPLKIDLAAAYNNQPIKARGTLGPLASLSATGAAPWPVDLTVEAGGATIKAKGSIQKPMTGEGLNLDVSAEGQSLATLGVLAGSELPPIGPYKLASHVTGADAKYDLTKLELTAGKTTLTGDLSVSPGKKPMEVRGNFSSKLIDLADFSPPGKKAEAKTSGPAGPAKPARSDGRVLPDTPLPLDALKDINADIKLRAEKLQSDQLALNDLAVDVGARNGALTIRPLTAVVSGGKINGDVSVSAAQTPQVTMKLAATGMDLGALLKALADVDLFKGVGDMNLNVTGAGKSIRAIAASLNGTTEVVIGQGEIQSRYVELIGADVLRTVAPWANKGGGSTKLNCMVSRFDIRNGVATVKDMLMDTQLVSMAGKGNIDLRSEKLDLQLTPQPKDASLVSLAVPINVTGTLANPMANPDPLSVAKGVGGMVGGAALGPLGLLLPLASAGAQDKNPCIAALQQQPATGQRGAPAQQPAQPSGPLQGIERGIRGIFNR